MKEKTLITFRDFLGEVRASGMTTKEYCEAHGLSYASVTVKMSNIKRSVDTSSNLYKEIRTLYLECMEHGSKEELEFISKEAAEVVPEQMLEELYPEDSTTTIEPVDAGNYTDIALERDENGKILYYTYKIYRRNKSPLVGKLSRDEMNIIYRLYSFYGASLTQREVSRYFPELSLFDFKRILTAFGIYKASSPFAPHIIEEHSAEELSMMQLREKENDFLRRIEEERVRNNERLLKQYATENAELKKQIENVKNLDFKILNFKPIEINKPNNDIYNEFVNVYIADMHVGATVQSGTMYDENINYGVSEIARRLQELANKLASLGGYDEINICLMGDMLDSCGVTNKTARLDHSLPENMDGYEQANAYITLIYNFVQGLEKAGLANKINLYSVRCGNHSGVVEYLATKVLFAQLQAQGFNCTLFESFFGTFQAGGHTFVLTHGKDDKFMKKGLPLNIDDKNKVMIYEWLDDNNIHGDNIHIIKGDLHSNNYNSCKKLDYRNVLSIFGASDYSSFNFGRNSYGVSFDLCIEGNLMRGEFQNM